MKQVTGDLIKLALAGEFDVIVQGCNCMNQMGKGIALTIKNTWPEVYAADCRTIKGDINKLGTITTATVVVANSRVLTVVNAYTQYIYNGPGVLSSVEAIAAAMLLVKQQYSGKKIGIPMIGAGLAKGNWAVISAAIDEVMQGEDLTLVVLPS
jgi:O-acetyl-ADP-ribose deacetylase (regulator of RNase III)